MYVMISTYLVPLDEVDKLRSAHMAFIDTLEERGLIVGAGRQTPPVGGVLILDVDSAEEASALIAEDPYVKANVAEYRPTGFTPARGVLKDFRDQRR